MKIRKLQLENIGVFDNETIKFQPCSIKGKAEIHIFTGQNGSGKTTILQSLAGAFQGSGNLQEEAKTEQDLIETWAELAKTTVPKNDAERRFFSQFENIFKVLENRTKKRQLTSLNKLESTFKKRFRFFEYDGKEKFVFKDEDKFKSQIKLTLNESDLIKIYGNPTWWNSVFSHTSSNLISEYKNMISVKGVPEGSMDFGVFAFSGYRYIESELIEALKEPKEFNPLSQSLDFVKDYNQDDQLTINQLIANNISKSAIEKGRNSKKADKFANVIKSIEQAISKITGWIVEFDLETEPTKLITKVNGEALDFDVLPDGLRSLISWIADLAGRVDLLRWQDDLPIFEKKLILFLDEIEVHLHPTWQRKILPVIQELFKNSQIFVSTHSPFVVNSVDDAWVYKLKLKNGKAKVLKAIKSENSNSITQVLREIFGVDQWFGLEVQNRLDRFEGLKNKILQNNSIQGDEETLLELAKLLASEPSDQLKQIIRRDLRQLSEIKGKDFSL